MMIDTMCGRAEWAARVTRQASQMLAIAGRTSDDMMRSELLEYAKQLRRHAAEIANVA